MAILKALRTIIILSTLVAVIMAAFDGIYAFSIRSQEAFAQPSPAVEAGVASAETLKNSQVLAP